MPIYELRCEDCGKFFETITRCTDDVIPCAHCGSENTQRLISMTTYRHADHWMKNMMGAMHKSQERDALKKEIKSQTP